MHSYSSFCEIVEVTTCNRLQSIANCDLEANMVQNGHEVLEALRTENSRAKLAYR